MRKLKDLVSPTLAAYLTEVIEQARQRLESHGRLQPVAVVIRQQGALPPEAVIVSLHWGDTEEGKEAVLRHVRQIAAEHQATCVLTIAEAWMVYPAMDSKRPTRLSPSEHPDRIEVVIVTVEVPEAQHTGIAQMLRGGGLVTFGDIDWMPPEVTREGRFSNLLPQNRRKPRRGYRH